MNVLVVSSKYPPEYSGSGHRIHWTYLRLRKRFGITHKVVTSSVEHARPCFYQIDDTSVFRISIKPGLFRLIPQAGEKLSRIVQYTLEAITTWLYLFLNIRRISLIHAVGNVNVTSAALTFCRVFRLPLIVELVNLTGSIEWGEPRWVSWLFGKGFPRSTKIVCISKALKDRCLELGYPEEQLWLRPNPVDEKRFCFDPKLRSLHRDSILGNQIEKTRLLVYIAKFMPRKRQDFLVDVALCLPPHYQVICAGPLVSQGPLADRDRLYFQSIQQRAQALGLIQSGRLVLIPEFVSDPERYFLGADVALFPAENEAFGTPIVEALACGTPVVANDIPGVFDQWITPGFNGALHRHDAQDWVNAISKLDDISLERRKALSERVLEQASTEVVDSQYRNILDQLKRSQRRHPVGPT